VVHRAVREQFFVTAFTTSKALDNPWFADELALTAKQADFQYDLVHFNNGLHGWHLSDEEYRRCYIELVRSIKRIFPAAKLSFATSTNCAKKTADGFVLNEADNAIVLRRNEIVRELGESFQLPVDDLYAVSVENMALHADDGLHYQQEGYEKLGGAVAAFLKSQR